MGNRRAPVLYPLSLIYGLLTGLRNFLYNAGLLRSAEFSTPVICVGNITAGGTGKTPLTAYIAALLCGNYKVAVLSRGYRRKSEGFVMASESSTVKDLGDELYQLKQNFPEIIAAADKNRVKGVKGILGEHPETSVIIMDDGFQHRRIKPGLSIVLIDHNRPVHKDFMLPYGNLRESRRNLSRADVLVVTKSPPGLTPVNRRIFLKELKAAPYQKVFFSAISYGKPRPVFGNRRSEILSPARLSFNDSGIVLITGIAYPDPLKEYLGNFFVEIIHLCYPDHYQYKESDINKMSDSLKSLRSAVRFAITTEKDAVRLTEFNNIAEPLRKVFYFIPAGIVFPDNTGPAFDNLILDYVRKNKGDNRVSQR